MDSTLNSLGQPVGLDVPGWTSRPRPPREAIEGEYCRVEPLDVERHARSLYDAFAEADDSHWTYLPYGPFASFEEYVGWLQRSCLGDDPLYFAVIERGSGRALGVASYLRIEPAEGCLEVGHICYSPRLQRTTAATEAMYLLMARAFELGYRRYEWKCDALNAPSRAAAERLGFSYEGTFRQARVYRGRNRDTAWYSVIDSEWPVLRDAFERWLDPTNFDERGRQRTRLDAGRALGRLPDG